MMLYSILFILSLLASCGPVNSEGKTGASSSVESQKDPCDDPDADISCSFLHMPSPITRIMSIGGPKEAGEKMVITGTIFKSDGKTPYPNVIMYAYHTDDKGYYSKSGNEEGAQKWHGRLHGWCKTDNQGRYEIRSIRPAPYPSNTMPAHIHPAIKEPGDRKPYHISDFVFKDDPLVNERYLKSTAHLKGGTGVVDLKKSATGIWMGQRNIVLKP